MWLLRNEDKGLTFRILPGKPNFVSRKDGDLLLLGDQSISRKHAEVTVHNENQKGGIVLKDLGSKYGTFTALGGGELTQASANQPIILNDGDSVRFGIQWNIWRVEYFPLVVATSTLNAVEKKEVKEMVAALGGEVVNDWQTCCTHLTMNKLTVTVKVVCALACVKPIVFPGYWKTLRDALASTESKLPNYEDFVPTLAEALLNPAEVSFTQNPKRSKLFSGHTFVASSAKQLVRIKPMITAAGGNAVEFSAISWPISKLVQDKTVLMQHSASDKQGSQQSQTPDGYIAAARKLKAAGVRCVPEAEIGLSVLYCSTAQYCNPRFSLQSLFGASSSQNTQPVNVICPNTQDSTKSEQIAASKSNKNKRPLEDSSEEEQHPSKRINSEDLFSSQAVEAQSGQSSNMPSTSSKKPSPTAKRPTVNPSLDMFAPSGQSNQDKNTSTNEKSITNKNIPNRQPIVNPSLDIFAPSGQSNQDKNTSTNEKSITNKNIPNRQPIVNPSLDLFAPSGQSSTKGNDDELNPSCQDIFASYESRQTRDKKTSDFNESHSIPPKKPRMVQENDDSDAFSFSTNKKTSKLGKKVEEKDDEFSFTTSRRSNRLINKDEGEEDEFSFVSTKKCNNQKKAQNIGNGFSFASNKHSKKRNRQSNPDMFDSSAESLASNDRAGTSNAKSRPNCRNASTNDKEEENDDLFAFAAGPATKRRKDSESDRNLDEPDAEVKLAVFSRKGNYAVDPQTLSEPVLLEEPANNNNIMTYSKGKPCPVIKEEVRDEELNELAKELQNATIVVVKPLVVMKQKPVEVQTPTSGKNFKKFRKVTGMNKRIVPHIIGGSDLVPHYANCQNIDDVLPPLPTPVTHDDDWGFPNEKKKGKNR